MNKYLPKYTAVLHQIEFAIEMMDKNCVQEFQEGRFRECHYYHIFAVNNIEYAYNGIL